MKGPLASLVVPLALAGCTTLGDGDRIPYCAPLEQLPPLAGEGTCTGPEAAEFLNRLSVAVEDVAGPLLVRVSLGSSAEVAAVCIDRSEALRAWRARSRLGDQLGTLLEAKGPACLANTRVDLNRYQAMLAKIEQVERECSRRLHASSSASQSLSSQALQRQFDDCVHTDSDWLLLYPYGQQSPIVFAQPQDPAVERLGQYETARRCDRPSKTLAWQIGCIEDEGWERLDPGPGKGVERALK